LGVLGGISTRVGNLEHMVRNLPGGSHWEVIGIGRDQWRLVREALQLDGAVRVGLEDNFYLPQGEMAKSNGDLVMAASRMTQETGREVATVREAKEVMGLL
ncbi:MAG: 3-keto-5-aminohexanoate cleavage protein, partial [Deltaproteobacteria bacterium]|nr:3-keto-5-aminohexanoate cleavage protein [Deltaproteobacteria bacterium]